MADAIEIFERLLRDSGLSSARSLELRRRYTARLQPSYTTLRGCVLGIGATERAPWRP